MTRRKSPMLSQRAEELRQQVTPAEKLLWEELRLGRATEKFRRQQVIGPAIADFYCPGLRLVVEVDGPIHEEPQQAENDRNRDFWMREQGYTVLRFTNNEVFTDTTRVANIIRREVALLKSRQPR